MKTNDHTTKGTKTAMVPLLQMDKIRQEFETGSESQDYFFEKTYGVMYPLVHQYSELIRETENRKEYEHLFKWEPTNMVSESAFFTIHRPPNDSELDRAQQRVFHYIIIHPPDRKRPVPDTMA